MPSTPRQPVQPATAHPQHCLNPACHAHNAHPTRPQPVVQPQPVGWPQVQQGPQRPAVQPMITLSSGRQLKINDVKNWIIGILLLLLVGTAGLLMDRDNEIDVLKVASTQSQTSGTPSQKLDYATRICKITHSKATYAQCVINIVGH
jgi:hypothetical protein